jgi:hypothetical protein
MKYLIILLLTNLACSRPILNVYHYNYFENEIGGYYQDKVKEIKRAHRLFQKLTSQKVTLKIKYLKRISPEVYFGCLSWNTTASDCIWGLYKELKVNKEYKVDKVAHYFVLPPIEYQETYWIGGGAITGCWKGFKPKREMNILAGIGFGNFLIKQNTGAIRVSQSIAIMMHEWGHLLLGLSHDQEEENFLMNSLFNVKGFSSETSPESWRISEKSKKEIRRCRGGSI